MTNTTCLCGHCGKPFPVVASRVARTKYCSLDCKNSAMEKKLIYTCAYPPCANIFTAKPSQKRMYCCKECFYDDRAIPIRPFPMGELERTQIEATILQFKPLVLSVAKTLCLEFNPRHMMLDDFIQEGLFGLMTAIQQDTDATPERFPGFAKLHIKMAIIYAYRTQEYTIRLPESLYRHDANVTPEQLRNYERLSSCVSIEDLATERDWLHPGKELASYSSYARSVRRMETYTNPVEENTLKNERIDDLYQSLRKLPPQQRQMIAEHYGLTCDATAMLQLCYKYKIARATMHRLVHHGLDVLKSTLTDVSS